MKKLPYKEGDWIAVPLRNGGYAVGRVARVSNKIPGGILGYFFGLRYQSVPKIDELRDINPKEAIGVYIFGDLGLLEGKWKVIGSTEPWQREQWAIPAFVRHEDFTERYWKVIYSDNDPSDLVKEEQISPEEAKSLPKNSIYGAGAIEITLSKLLDKK